MITRNTTLFDPGWWQLPGSEKRYRDWKKWGHGRLNVTRSLEESADTFFYQVAYDMGIDHDLSNGWVNSVMVVTPVSTWRKNVPATCLPAVETETLCKKPWYQGDTIPVGIGQGYWTATPIQMSKALMILINDGIVKGSAFADEHRRRRQTGAMGTTA